MWRSVLAAILLAGCAQLPPTPQDMQAKKFEALPGKSVIYLVRDRPDFNDAPATVWLGDDGTVTTYPGTYYRWEVAPGTRRIAGYASDSGAIALQAEPGKVYFVQQRVTPFTLSRSRPPQSHFYVIPEASGRDVATRGQLVQ